MLPWLTDTVLRAARNIWRQSFSVSSGTPFLRDRVRFHRFALWQKVYIKKEYCVKQKAGDFSFIQKIGLLCCRAVSLNGPQVPFCVFLRPGWGARRVSQKTFAYETVHRGVVDHGAKIELPQ